MRTFEGTGCGSFLLTDYAHGMEKLFRISEEGWGRVVIEANAVGIPAIGYDVPGLRDSIKDGYNGLLCNPSPRAMAEKIRMLKGNPELMKELGKNSLKWARNFDWDKSAEGFLRVIEGMVNERR